MAKSAILSAANLMASPGGMTPRTPHMRPAAATLPVPHDMRPAAVAQ
jgi:hypothetical protein